MPVVDLRTAREKSYDCIVSGTGPAGLAVALPLAEAGRSVLLIEAGSDEPRPGPDAQYDTPSAHAVSEITHCQALGGTSWLWGGRTIPLLPHDFAATGWPFAHEEIACHFRRAAAFLGGSFPDEPFFDTTAPLAFDLDAREVLANTGSLLQWHRPQIDARAGPDVLMQATTTGILLARRPSGCRHCAGLRVRVKGAPQPADLRADNTVLAQGGIETARLLLAERARAPDALGHLVALGRFYAGHLTGSVASIVLRDGEDVESFGWQPLPARGSVRRIFRSTASAMEAGVNMFFWAQNWPIADAMHGSGLLSAKHLVSRTLRRPPQNTAPLGPGVAGPARSAAAPAHLRNLVRDRRAVLRGLPAMVGARLNRRRKALDHLVLNGARRYRLAYHSEQESRPENRIELTGKVEADCLPQIRIAFDFSPADIDRVLRGHELLDAALATTGIAKMHYDQPPEPRRAVVRALAQDGYHQTGMARAGLNPSDSVVDRNCQVHGVENLFVAGSAVFRNSAAAQPTLSIVALSMRMAQHIAETSAARVLSATSAS